MISRQDIQRLLHRADSAAPVLSVFLDMDVNEDNKRTYRIFLRQQRSEHLGLDGDRPGHPNEPLGAAFDRIQQWIDDEFDVANKGAAIYTAVGGDWLDGIQFPVSIPNRVVIGADPVLGPIAQIVGRPHHYGVVVVDRECLRLIDVRLGTPLAEYEVKTSPYPTPGDVKAGGEAAKSYQKGKAEESRHFFKVFSLEIGEFVNRYRPDGLILMGTMDNVQRFVDFLPLELQDRVVHVDNAPVVPTSAEVLKRLAPFFEEHADQTEAQAIELLRDRVQQRHFAVAGFDETLERLQEGKLDTLVLARRVERTGTHCLRCGFYLADTDGSCRYCGGSLESGVDLVEAMIRLAAEQEVDVTFADPTALTDLDGTGGLLSY
jgi:hypothetical protein